MLRNYLKIAFRNLRRQKGYAFINVTGLAVGMACCILIALYVRQELSYDQFLPNADRVYRVAMEARLQDAVIPTAYTARPLAEALAQDFPEVEASTRLWYDPTGSMVVRYSNQIFPEDRLFYGDPEFFKVLGFPLLQGDPETALRDPFSIILTASTAHKYFGDADPIGQVLHIREPSDRDVFDYTVTGVMADIPANSHLAFDFLASYVTQRQSRSQSWLGFGVYTYAKLREGTGAAAFEAKLPALFATYGGPQVQQAYNMSLDAFEASGNYYQYFLQPVTDIHLHSNLEDEIKPTSDANLVYLFGAIALFVLLLAGINFVNFATARGATRMREVGVRKVMGARREQLIRQFLIEALILTSVALMLAILLVEIATPFFNDLTGQAVEIQFTEMRWLLPALAGLGLLVGLGAGAYPAFFLSGFQPVSVLKGRSATGQQGRLRDVLVVFQFGIATALIACTAVVYSQMQYMTNKHLGFAPEQVVVLEGAEVFWPQGEAFRDALRALPGAVAATNSEQVPGRHFNGSWFKPLGTPDDAQVILEYTYASYDYVETLGMELVAGRSLSRDHPTDSLAVLLNESAVQQLGFDDPIGQQLDWPGERVYTVVGVVKDFHVTSLHREIGPMALLGPDPEQRNRPNLLISARIKSENWSATLASIEAIWHQFAPQAPFVYSFLDDTFAQLYEAEQRASRLITLFTGLAILIACFGLFGLAAYMVEQRTKEIGVRKVLGASVGGIVALLSKDFTKLVAIGICIATPLAYVLMHRWLEGFAYAIELGVGLFIGAGLLALAIAWLTVSYQSIKAARANPIEALRYE